MRNETVAEPLRSAVNAASPLVDGEPVNYEGLPLSRWRETMRLYIEGHIDPGTGWKLVLSDSLRAVTYCDDAMVANMPSIWRWIHNHAPATCHGSAENVRKWLAREENE